MGVLDRLFLSAPEREAVERVRSREKFAAQWSIGDPAFAAWLNQDEGQETVNAYTVLGLAAVLRAVSIISTTIAGLPLKTYEKADNGERVQIPSEFDDPYPGMDGLPPFAWVETILWHLLIWRNAYLWHEARADGSRGIAYRPLIPSAIAKVTRENGRRVFEVRETVGGEVQRVGSETVTYIPGPSLDGVSGHPLLLHTRAVFSAAISGDKTAQRTLRKGIRIAGLVTPGDNEQDDFDATEGEAILESLRANVLGSQNAGDIAVINRRLKLQPWNVTSNIESQFHETLMYVLMEIEQIFGIPPHLMADTEKQTSWGTGVGEQNLSLARFTLRGWSDRLEQWLSKRLPARQFVEFDYVGLLQGTPAEEIHLLIDQVNAGLLTVDEARRIRNLPPLTPAQKGERALTSGVGTPVHDPGVPAV